MTIFGPDFLGLAHPLWPVSRSIRAFPQGAALGVLDCEDTFGRCLEEERKFLQTGRVSDIRAHLHWHKNHTITPLKKLEKKLPEYERLAKDYPGNQFYISHSLEYDESSKKAVQKRVDAINSIGLSNIFAVNCCLKGAFPGQALLERHGIQYAQNADIVSTDGAAKGGGHSMINAEKWLNDNVDAGRVLAFVWGARFNLREIGDPGDPPPPPYLERTAAPSIRDIKAHLRLMYTKGIPPVVEFSYVPLKKPQLYKAISEDSQGSSNPRENKPCFITQENVKLVYVITMHGEKIGQLAYGGTFQGGLHRYYAGIGSASNMYGYQFGEKALKQSGSEFVWLKAGGNLYGPIHPAFREGVYVNK